MAILKTRLKAPAAAATVVPVVTTWTTNEPTASAAQTIANGTVPTVAELGQYVANTDVVIAALVADIADLRSKLDE
tara:strand:- start:8564 stop:8791 length:228 start_codon:yes stop_codon:yes gene_type:complete